MAITTTYEASLLQPLEAIIARATNNRMEAYEARLQCLEFWASTIGGFDYGEYCSSFDIQPLFEPETLHEVCDALTRLSEEIPADKALIISALSREPLDRSEQKEAGAYYTDFRLASLIGMECEPILTAKEKNIADLASGSGILLAAAAVVYKKKFPTDIELWLQQNAYAFDMSEYALRGCRIALSTFLSSVKGIKAMTNKWRLMDSLLDDKLPICMFDIIVGNPPWGKIKLSRHSYLLKNGSVHTYGADYDYIDSDKFSSEKRKLANYRRQLRERYEWLRNTESDTYIAFLERAISAIKAGGRIFMLLPAGIIRSKGTYLLREKLFSCSYVRFVVISNRARFFAIDTRFKFLLLDCDLSERSLQLDAIKLIQGDGSKSGVTVSEPVTIPLTLLKKARPDLTIPEVRTPAEFDLFFRINEHGCGWGNSSEWSSDIIRELDMTNDRRLFATKPNGATIALVEGRMVQQHIFPVKKYISGSGRAAKWEPSNGELKPQFWINPKDLSKQMYARVQMERVGYCDIAGQTNERSMMSAIIPTGVVCGNKVPTVTFVDSHNGERELLWVGITNSFVYDWMLRRVISTTANYFLILSIPMPDIAIDSELAGTIIAATSAIRIMRNKINPNEVEIARLRCRIDIAVAEAYRLEFDDIKLILDDFPLLDRKQPPIRTENRSTVTRDYLLSEAAKHFDINADEYIQRYNEARDQEAIPYMPTDIVLSPMELQPRGSRP